MVKYPVIIQKSLGELLKEMSNSRIFKMNMKTPLERKGMIFSSKQPSAHDSLTDREIMGQA